MSLKRISTKEARNILDKPNAILLDIRAFEDYNESHDPISTYLVSGTLPSFIEHTSKECPIVVMCYHGNSSQMVAQYLAAQGFVEVYSLDGGYEEWQKGL